MEEQREVTSACDASNSAGQELHTEVGWIINKVACGFVCCSREIGKGERRVLAARL